MTARRDRTDVVAPRAVARCGLLALALIGLAGGALAQAPLLRTPGAEAPPRRSSFDRHLLLDCAEHGVWRPPEGWTAHALDGGALALAPDGSAAIARVPARPRLRDDARFAALVARIVERIAGAAPTLGAVEGRDRNRWRRERTIRGTVLASGSVLAVSGRADRDAAVWVGLYGPEDASARRSVEGAIASWAMLVSHACQCGYDCDRRPD
jgi:hypothetical protein